LEALVRLAEARAKMGLKKEITVEDADAVIRLMNASLKQVGIDTETGRSDIDTIMVGRTKSQRERIDLILKIVNELSGGSKEGFIPVQRIIDAAISQGVEEQYARDAVEKLLKEGILFSSSKPGFVKKV
jgi:replicative DNA helicase Mcm